MVPHDDRASSIVGPAARLVSEESLWIQEDLTVQDVLVGITQREMLLSVVRDIACIVFYRRDRGVLLRSDILD